MVFNPDPSKQAQEVIFSRKAHSPKHPDLYFNNLVVGKVKIQKHLRLNLGKKFSFKEHLKHKFAIVNKGIKYVEEIEQLSSMSLLSNHL